MSVPNCWGLSPVKGLIQRGSNAVIAERSVLSYGTSGY